MRKRTAITLFVIICLSIAWAFVSEYYEYQQMQDINKKLDQVIVELKK